MPCYCKNFLKVSVSSCGVTDETLKKLLDGKKIISSNLTVIFQIKKSKLRKNFGNLY